MPALTVQIYNAAHALMHTLSAQPVIPVDDEPGSSPGVVRPGAECPVLALPATHLTPHTEVEGDVGPPPRIPHGPHFATNDEIAVRPVWRIPLTNGDAGTASITFRTPTHQVHADLFLLVLGTSAAWFVEIQEDWR